MLSNNSPDVDKIVNSIDSSIRVLVGTITTNGSKISKALEGIHEELKKINDHLKQTSQANTP